MKPKIRISGYEQVRWGDSFSVYPPTEGSPIYEGTLTFVNYGGPEPAGNCQAVSPLSFPAIQFDWLETHSFPLRVRVTVDTTYFTSGQYHIPEQMVTDYSASLSSLVVRNYEIPIEFWVGGARSVYTLFLHLEWNRQLTNEEKKLSQSRTEFWEYIQRTKSPNRWVRLQAWFEGWWRLFTGK